MISVLKRSKIILLPLGRIVLAILLVGGAVAVAQILVKTLKGALSLGGTAPALYYIAFLIASILVAYFVYRAYVHLIEKRVADELSRTRALRELGVGMLIGLGLVFIIVCALWGLGYYRVVGMGALTASLALLANDGAGAFVEEVLLRGVVFRISEERLGTWISIAISALLFAFLHLASPNASMFSAIVVGLEGGILLSAAYVLTRRLWLAIGIHFAWDFAQDAIFGVSGSSDGILRANLSGPVLISGGNSGIEGSILALVLCLAVSVYMLRKAGEKGHIMRLSRGRKPTGPNSSLSTG